MIEKLLAVAPPPERQKPAPLASDWERLEKKYGLTYPADFKAIIATYGRGHFADFFGIGHPFDPAQSPPYDDWVKLRLDGIAFAQRAYPKDAVTFPLHPTPDGLFPWGYTDNGGTLCWLVNPTKNNWPIICLDDACSKEADVFDLSTADFLTGWLTNEIIPKAITPPDFFPLSEPIFIPRR